MYGHFYLPRAALSHPVAHQVPEYCKVMSEAEVSRCAFELIFAFDEIIALGYRENVNLSQIRTIVSVSSPFPSPQKITIKPVVSPLSPVSLETSTPFASCVQACPSPPPPPVGGRW